jgi:hypothetical protein
VSLWAAAGGGNTVSVAVQHLSSRAETGPSLRVRTESNKLKKADFQPYKPIFRCATAAKRGYEPSLTYAVTTALKNKGRAL